MQLYSCVLYVRNTVLRCLRYSELSTDCPHHTGLSPSFTRSLHCALSTHSPVQSTVSHCLPSLSLSLSLSTHTHTHSPVQSTVCHTVCPLSLHTHTHTHTVQCSPLSVTLFPAETTKCLKQAPCDSVNVMTNGVPFSRSLPTEEILRASGVT